jgi:hypothetical protein
MPIPPQSPGQAREQSRRIFVSYSHFDYDASCSLRDILGLIADKSEFDEQLAWADKKKNIPYYKALDKLCEQHKDESITIDLWIDRHKLKGGSLWKTEIQAAMEEADTFVILLSTKYATSRFCRDIELRHILKRQHDRNALVIPIALHEIELADFHVKYDRNLRLEVSDVQCLPQGLIDKAQKLGLKPVSKWGRQKDAWTQIRIQLEDSLKKPVSDKTALSAQALKSVNAVATNLPSTGDCDYLPYLCDRSAQSFSLMQSLKSWANQKRPIVVLTEGRLIDSPDGWLDRMHRDELIDHLGLVDTESTFGRIKKFEWPVDAASITDAADRFTFEISNRLGLKGLDRNIETVIATQQKSGIPTLWAVECLDSESTTESIRALQGLLELLRKWPVAGTNGMLVFALNIVRADDAKPDQRAQLGAEFEKVLRFASQAGHITLAALGSLTELKLSEMTTWAADDRVAPRLKLQNWQIPGQLAEFKPTLPMQKFVALARSVLA